MFDHDTVEALLMRWLKRDRRKIGIALSGMLLLLALMAWLPVAVVDADERVSELVGPVAVAVQATPTEDATVTALNKEKLTQEVQQLKNQNERDPFGWLQTNASILLSTLVVVIGALFGFWQWNVGRRDAQNKELEDRRAERERRDEEQKRWLEDRRAERERRAEERFQAVVEGLGSEREEAKLSAAINLRTFLRPGYEQFYIQTYDLAVAHLRLPRTAAPSKDPDNLSHAAEDPNTPLPLTPLSQALSVAFKEAFPLARNITPDVKDTQRAIQSLDASDVQLDRAYLVGADLKQIKLSRAFLREAALWRADFGRADLWRADFSRADLSKADLREADFREANLSGAKLWRADLSGAKLSKADLSKADLSETDLWQADLKEARSLQNADLRGVKGLTEEQLEACKAKGAIIDEDSTVSSSQSTISPFSPLQSNDLQAPLAPSAQGGTPTSNADGSSATSSKPSPES